MEVGRHDDVHVAAPSGHLCGCGIVCQSAHEPMKFGTVPNRTDQMGGRDPDFVAAVARRPIARTSPAT